MNPKLSLLFVSFGLFFAMPVSSFAQQAPNFFDSFLFDNAGQPAQNFNGFIQWDVTDGSVDLLGGNVPGATDQVNGRFVELGGSTGDAGAFATKVALPFTAGTTYNLRFDYKSSDGNSNSAQVSVGSNVYTFSTSSTELQTFNQTFVFANATTAKIIFQNLDNDNNGVGIDNVVLSVQSTPPPLFFDAFLFDNAGQPMTDFNNFIQWDVTDGTVDLLGGNVPGAVDQMNGRFVELGGSSGDAGVFSTKLAFPFLPNTTYNLAFDYKSSDGNTNSAQAVIGSQNFTVTTAATELQHFSQNFSFNALTNAKLAFQNLGSDDNNGIGIDNVVLSQVLVPTAASVTIGGRVTTQKGRGISGAIVQMRDASGALRTARCSSFGYYRFNDVEAGQTYIFTVESKRYVFAEQTQVRNITGEDDEINFTATNY